MKMECVSVVCKVCYPMVVDAYITSHFAQVTVTKVYVTKHIINISLSMTISLMQISNNIDYL